jgi:glutathione peroxidase-family protein
MSRFHEFQMDAITGENVDFSEFEGTLSLVVNVATR